ncbi:hypothetical protein [Nannocystis punicea]|uniref:Uncharacterized protein n=1 Tax=Nannocystis punicea TaxID=2995304 RepID=A0ABY7GWR2_9BACT|nr:hypothetical protein [Nannocystis poenicansa]WAS91424.1 hypothetical protein O0S08_35005 [Nannocystis poenicansa]
MRNHRTPSASALLLILTTACSPGYFLGSLTGAASEGDDGSTGATTDLDTSTGSGDTSSSGEAPDGPTGGVAECPPPGDDFDFELDFDFWDGTEPDELSVDCTVVAFEPGATQHIELECLYDGESTPRQHGVDVTLPVDATLAVTVGDLVHLEYGYTPSFDKPLAFHAGLSRDGAPVFLFGGGGTDLLPFCAAEDSVLSIFAAWGMSFTHGQCELESIERVDFVVGDETTSLYNQSAGLLPDGTLAIIGEALRQEEFNEVACGYQILLVTPAQ